MVSEWLKCGVCRIVPYLVTIVCPATRVTSSINATPTFHPIHLYNNSSTCSYIVLAAAVDIFILSPAPPSIQLALYSSFIA